MFRYLIVVSHEHHEHVFKDLVTVNVYMYVIEVHVKDDPFVMLQDRKHRGGHHYRKDDCAEIWDVSSSCCGGIFHGGSHQKARFDGRN